MASKPSAEESEFIRLLRERWFWIAATILIWQLCMIAFILHPIILHQYIRDISEYIPTVVMGIVWLLIIITSLFIKIKNVSTKRKILFTIVCCTLTFLSPIIFIDQKIVQHNFFVEFGFLGYSILLTPLALVEGLNDIPFGTSSIYAAIIAGIVLVTVIILTIYLAPKAKAIFLRIMFFTFLFSIPVFLRGCMSIANNIATIT